MAAPEVALEADRGGTPDGRALACGLWTAPAAWFAFRGGYMTHGYIYAASVAVVMVLAPVGMHLMGIRDEKDFDETELA